VEPADAGVVLLSPAGGSYEQGTSVTATAQASENYVFDHWSGDLTGTAVSGTLTMNGQKSVVAHFVPSEPPNQQPEVSFTQPQPNAHVAGDVKIAGTASDADGSVEFVEVRIDSGTWHAANGTTAWELTLRVDGLAAGEHTLYARAYDGSLFSHLDSLVVEVVHGSTDTDNGKNGRSSLPITLIGGVTAIIALALIGWFVYARRRR
jgi:hypothetical protein